VSGDVQRYDTSDDDNFSQVALFWSKVLQPDERKRLAENIAGHLKGAQPFIQERAVKNFSQVNPEFGRLIREGLNKYGRSNGAMTHYQTNATSYKHNSNL
jgi:catalase